MRGTYYTLYYHNRYIREAASKDYLERMIEQNGWNRRCCDIVERWLLR